MIFLYIILFFGHAYSDFPYIRIPNILPKPVSDAAKELLFETVCYGELGCFYTGPPFYHPTARPISVAPQLPNTTYKLYTPKNPDHYYDLKVNDESIRLSPFNAHLPTKFVVHGFEGILAFSLSIKVTLKNALLFHGDYNVIVVDWSKQSGFPFYQAGANVRTVGAELGLLIIYLMRNTNIKPESVHVIGHSYGVQVAGHAGERVPRLGKITALDPGGPYSYVPDTRVRLDPTDALYVDSIHTDSAGNFLQGFGNLDPLGDIDFYVNGGETQPGCKLGFGSKLLGFLSDWFLPTRYLNTVCDHFRAVEYYIESIYNPNCDFIGVQCESYEGYLAGECNVGNSRITEMGIDHKPIPGLKHPAKFYLKTNSKPPFCMKLS